jgi:nitronate monooxygenase
MLTTTLTRDWGLKHPLVQAPMAGVAGGRLARAVCEAGGMGMIGVGSTVEARWLEEQVEEAGRGGRFGLGLLLWALDNRPELLDLLLAQRPFALCLSFGDPTPFVERIHAAGVLVLAQVQTAELAEQALQAGVDALVAQGTEGGGHTGSVGTLPLLQRVLEIAGPSGIPVLAGGGIATGRAIAGLLAMGCEGVWIGTRFAASEESMFSAGARAAIERARETDTVHTHVFDLVQGAAWPDAFPGRALRNAFTETWHGREDELSARMAEVRGEYEAACQRDDTSQSVIYAGQAAGLIDESLPAGEIVEVLMRDAEEALRGRFPSLLG